MANKIRKLRVKLIIESGRERGYSTLFLARYFPKFIIVSIDCDKKSNPDLPPNVVKLFGDSRFIFEEYINQPCVVFIDAPKCDESILMAIKALKNPRVKGVFIHDINQSKFLFHIAKGVFKKVIHSNTLTPSYGNLNKEVGLDENYDTCCIYVEGLTPYAEAYINYLEYPLAKYFVKFRADGWKFKVMSFIFRHFITRYY